MHTFNVRKYVPCCMFIAITLLSTSIVFTCNHYFYLHYDSFKIFFASCSVTFCFVSVMFACKHFFVFFFVTSQIFPFHKHYLSGQYGAPYPGGPKFESHSDQASTSLILKLIKVQVQHIHHPFIPSVSFPPCTYSYPWPNSMLSLNIL